METIIKRYTIGDARLRKSRMEYCTAAGKGVVTYQDTQVLRRVFFRQLDSVKKDSSWGRLHMDLWLSDGAICTIYVLADNQSEKIDEILFGDGLESRRKAEYFCRHGKKTGTNCKDALLYGLCGRYLYLYMEICGPGTGAVSNIFVENPGDNFMPAFPEVYHDPGSFFHRYLSIFSSLYQDMQRQIEMSHTMLDGDSATRQLMNQYLLWLGLPEEALRLPPAEQKELLKNLFWLNRRKGTQAAVKKLTEILLGEPAVITEPEKKVVALLINQRKEPEKAEKLRLLLKVFLPVGVQSRLVFEDELPQCDKVSYLDFNVTLTGFAMAKLDEIHASGTCMLGGEEDGRL